MRREIRISGFGGQGVGLAGYILGKALTLYDGKEAVMTQSYGPEARGGASSANVVVADEPIYSEQHLVAVVLTETYPTTAPLMEWLTPIFHPNIRPDGQEVCIGDWYPAKTLDQLVRMLGEMIQYVNYASHDPLHLEATLWAMAHRELFPVNRRLLLDPQRTVFAGQPTQTEARELDIRIL